MNQQIPSSMCFYGAVGLAVSTEGTRIYLGAVEGLLIWPLILAFAFNLVAIYYLVRITDMKKTTISTGTLWCIGIFTTAITLGVLVCVIPDNRPKNDVTDGLPEL